METQKLVIAYTDATSKDEIARLIGEKILSNPDVKKDKSVEQWGIINKRVPFDCPIDVVGGIPPFTDCREINLQEFKTCSDCVQKWLNQEADQPRPQWQDAMMKNFLRR